MRQLTRTHKLWLVYAPAALAVGAFTLALVVTSDHEKRPVLTVVLGLFVGWSFIASGLVAWSRRPHNPTGRLLVAVGFTWFIGAFNEANASVPFTLGLVFQNIFLALFFHLLVAYPSGRLEGRVKQIVGSIYAVALLAGLLPLFFDAHPVPHCPKCPSNALLVDRNHAVASALNAAFSVAGVVVALVVIVLIVRSWRRATVTSRRALAPVLLSGGLMIFLFGLTFVIHPVSHRAADLIDIVAFAAFISVPFFFLLGLLRGRLATRGVGRLLIDVPESPTLEQAQDGLRRALRDPTLELAYWLPERGRFIDTEGRPFELPADRDGRVTTRIEYDDRPVAALVHDASLREEPELLEGVVAAARLTLEKDRLQAELRARLEELHASRSRIVEAGDAERRRLERNLHDGAQQRLVALSLSLRLAQSKLYSDPHRADEILSGASVELALALEELRELARGIHPAVLSDRGLVAALTALTDRAPVPVELETVPDERLPGPVEAAAFYVVSESLANVAKYAQASSARVRVTRDNGHAVVEVADDGVGGADPARGSGLRGLADRVEALDGRLKVESPPGAGTRIRAEIPCA